MGSIKCEACGKRYDYYEHGCCPQCGAFNRPPRRDRVDADGTVHHLTDEEFLSNGAARRRSQGGKVCFERDECYEAQPRKVRSDPDLTQENNSPFSARVRQNSAAKEKKRSPARMVAVVVVAVMVANILPLLLTMCSVSGVWEDISGELFDVEVGYEQAIPEPLPDGETEYTTYVGNTFIWWDNDAAVVEVTVDEQEGYASLDLTMWRVEDYDEPVVFYDTLDGWREKAGCDSVSKLEEELYIYHYTLDGYDPAGECYAFFDGYNGNVYCEVKVPLTEDFVYLTGGDSVQVCTYAEVGETFWWWNEEIVVEDAKIAEEGSYAEIFLVMNDVSGDLEAPMIWYWNENGEETLGYCDQGWLEGDCWIWSFQVYDRMPGTDCRAVFTDDTGEVQVLLN